MSQFLVNALSTTAVSTALIVVLAWLFRSWIGERLKNAIKHEYDREIESYKTILSHVHAATAAGQQAAIEARIRAFDRLWKAVLAVRSNTGMITTFLDVLSVEEYAGMKGHEDFQRMVGDLDHKRIEKMVPDSGIEEVRPYVGEIVWALFFAYQAVNVRIVLLAWTSKTDDEKIHWYKDAATRGMLRAVLTNSEMEQFDATQIGKIALFRRLIESRLLRHWQRLVSGAEFGDEALGQAMEILAATNQLG